MTDWRTRALQQPGDEPSELAAREVRHRVLIDLLDAYADHELPAEAASQVEAHLVGCGRCRRELATHVALRERLAAEPVEPASRDLRERIRAATAAVPAPTAATVPVAPAAPPGAGAHRLLARRPDRGPRTVLAAAVVALAVAAGAMMWRGHAGGRADGARADGERVDGRYAVAGRPLAFLGAPPATVPLLAAALADYRRVSSSELPGRARDLDAVRAAVGFGMEPLHARALHLVGAWTTTLDGEPAAVLAYRYDDRVLVQYFVSEESYFRSPVLRATAAAGRALGATAEAQGVVAWPEPTAGTILIGEGAPQRLADAVSR